MAQPELSVDTPGAPQPKDYPLGGRDPQYLKDKEAFIQSVRTTGRPPIAPTSPTSPTSSDKETVNKTLKERFQKLAGIKKKK